MVFVLEVLLNQCNKIIFMFKNIVLVISIIKTYQEWMTTNLKYFFHSVTSHSNLHSYFKYADIARRKLNTFLSKQISLLLKAKEFWSTKTMSLTMYENRFKSQNNLVDVIIILFDDTLIYHTAWIFYQEQLANSFEMLFH